MQGDKEKIFEICKHILKIFLSEINEASL